MKRLLLLPFLIVTSFGASLLTVPSDIEIDPELARQEKAHAIEEVRKAISLCRQGDYESAIPTLKKYSERGDVGMTYILGHLYWKGLGMEASPKSAREFFQQNVDADHVPSMISLGELVEKETPARALQLYRLAAQKDSLTALLKLGDIYERGILGLPSNPKLAAANYQKLSDLGSPQGDSLLARCYAKGFGVEKDVVKATQLFRKAALANHVPSQLMMAGRYFAGEGCDTDPVAATGWLTRASQSGSSEATLLLAQRYENGDAILQDLDAAGRLYSKLASSNHPVGYYHLGRFYATGKGAKPDLVRAFVLISQATGVEEAPAALEEIKKNLKPEQLALAKKKLTEALELKKK
jgi:uncharacterized protein